MKILVVDDDKEIVELLSIYLKNEGYEPIAAYSGKEAITKLTTTPDIALMILDVMMPNMSGIEVIKEVSRYLEKQDKSSMTLNIEPENMGKVKISVEVNDKIVKANITVETEVVKNMLESKLGDLQSNLNKKMVVS